MKEVKTSHSENARSIVRNKISSENCRLTIYKALAEANQVPFFIQKSITIKLLKDCKETIPQLAEWMYDQWKSYDASLTLEKMIESFKERLNNDRIPFVVVAFINHQPIGMIGLKEKGAKELTNVCPSNTPWIGALFVTKNQRRKGIAGHLLKFIISLAKKLGHQEVFVYTSDDSNVKWYTDRGTTIVKDHYPFRKHKITLMKFSFPYPCASVS